MRYFVFILLIFAALTINAKKLTETYDEVDEKARKSKVAKVIKIKEPEKTEKKNGFVIIPMIYYTPETSFAFGGSFLYYYRLKSQTLENRPSYFETHVIYTLKNQIIGVANKENYFFKERLHLYERLEVTKYPDVFYGLGNDNPDSLKEDFTSFYTLFDLNAEIAVVDRFFIGLSYNLSYYKMYDKDDTIRTGNNFGEVISTPARLSDGTVPGSDGGLYSGLGLFLRYDTRDRYTYPANGNFSTIKLMGYHKYLGSDVNFLQLDLDFRHYLELFNDVIIAVQFKMEFNFGDVPFTMMPEVGGAEMLRGYPEGIYRDKNAFFFQTELRLPLYWRFGWVVFFSVGDVFNEFEDLSKDLIKYSGGIGLRFTVDKQERINVRADFGMTPEGGNIYFFMLEAF